MSKLPLSALGLGFVLLAPTVRGDDEIVKKPDQAVRQIVELKLSGNFAEDPKPENPFGPQPKNFRSQLLLLRQIAADPTVVGVKLEVEDIPDFARSLDLLHELRAVEAAGKKIVAYTEGLTQRTLMFASVADELWMPPSGQIALEGLVVEVMYLKNLLAMLDIEMKIVHIGDYKTAYEDFARESMSPQQREVVEHLLEEYWNELLDTIATNRGIERAAVEKGFEAIYVDAPLAKQLGFVSSIGYEDEFDARVKEMFGDAKLVDDYGDGSAKEDLEKMMASPFAIFSMLPKLLNPPAKKLKDEPRIAIVYATGAIVSGKSTIGFNGEVSSMGSETIVEALEKALEDDWVKAVVLRVNSPGGSALASDMIWRATQRVKAKKPIISSMGGVAGSGGYWISMGCDRIVAQPSTITGSIGVVGMLPDVSKTLKRFGVNVDVVGKGPHVENLALMKNGPTPELEARIREMMNQIYGEFVKKVSAGRSLPTKNVEALAKGRVWTGRQALENGLVDQLGGLEESIALACQLGGGLDAKTVGIVEYPSPKSVGEALEEMFEDLASVKTPVKLALAELGLDSAVAQIDALARSLKSGNADTIQAVMPISTTVR